MDRLETLLTETMAERARLAPTGPVPLTDRRHRTRSLAAVGAVCLVVIVVAVGVAALRPSTPNRPDAGPGPGPGPGQTSTVEPLPADVRLASYGQVSVQVPSTLPTRTSLCGSPVRQEVVAQDGSGWLCPRTTNGLARHPGTVVWFSTRQQATPYAVIATAPTNVDGYPARRGYGDDQAIRAAGVSGVIRLPTQHLVVGVTAPNRRMVNTILDSIRVDAVNPLGCAATQTKAATTPSGPRDILVPGTPALAVRCEYGTSTYARGLLIGSYPLSQPQTNQLVTALNKLRPDPCHCVHGGTPAPGHYDVLYFHYTVGSTLRVDGAVGANLDTYTNHSRTVANYSSSISELLAQLTHQS